MLVLFGRTIVLVTDSFELALLGLTVVWLVLDVSYFFGASWARTGIVVMPLVFGAVSGLANRGAGIGLSVVLPTLVSVAIAAAAYRSPRNKLFFKLDVTRDELQRTWDLYRNNQAVRTGLILSFLGLLPFVSFLSLFLSILGLARVNPDARPPIGRQGQAIAGIVLSLLGILWTVFVLVIGTIA